MSTQINVTVGSGGLSDKAKQLQAGARQAQLEKERQRRIEAEGAAERTARFAAEGRNAQGQSLTGTPNTTPRPQDEPAAFRSATDDYLMLLPSGGVQTGIPFPASTYLDALGQWTPIWANLSNSNGMVYQEQGGPSGAPALSTGADGTSTNNSIGGRANFFPADSKSKSKTTALKNFTLEFFLRWPSFLDTTYNSDFFLISCGNIPGFSGFSDLEIDIERGVDPSGNDFRYVTIVVQSPYYPPTGSVGPRVFEGAYNLDPDRVPLSDPGSFGYVDGALNPIVDLQWQHYALVSKQVPGAALGTFRQKLSFYINGVQYSGTSGAAGSDSVYWEPPSGADSYQLSSVDNENRLNLNFGGTNQGGSFTGPLKLHGLKLTPKALYDGNFTPPARIRP